MLLSAFISFCIQSVNFIFIRTPCMVMNLLLFAMAKWVSLLVDILLIVHEATHNVVFLSNIFQD